MPQRLKDYDPMRRAIAGKRMIITGASSGLGRALAELAAQRGARLLLASRSEQKLRQVADSINAAGGHALALPIDLTSERDRRRLIDAAAEQLGGLDILVNNAGTGAFVHVLDMEPELLRHIMELNFFATAELCRLAIPLLSEGEQPLIVNVSSRSGRRGIPGWAAYSASKFAVCGFSEALRAELARFDIHVLLVVPGLINTGFNTRLLANRGRIELPQGGLSPQKAAKKLLRAIERNKSELRMELGARLLLAVNWLAPRLVDWIMARIIRRLYADEIAQRIAKRNSSAQREGRGSIAA